MTGHKQIILNEGLQAMTNRDAKSPLRALCGGLWLLIFGTGVFAREVIRSTERLDSDRPEVWAMNYFTSITVLSGFGAPRPRAFGEFEVGLELGWIPRLSHAESRIGFDGSKEEDLNHSPLFARPRLTVGLPWQFALTVAYVPPIRLFGVKPDLFALALERPFFTREQWTIGWRISGQLGEVDGPFTCPAELTRFAPGSDRNPFGCEAESRDTATQNYLGAELIGAYRFEQLHGLTLYSGVLGNFLDTRVDVNARTFGFIDQSSLKAETWTFAWSGGISVPLDPQTSVAVGFFYSPLAIIRSPAGRDNEPLVNVRAQIAYRFR